MCVCAFSHKTLDSRSNCGAQGRCSLSTIHEPLSESRGCTFVSVTVLSKRLNKITSPFFNGCCANQRIDTIERHKRHIVILWVSAYLLQNLLLCRLIACYILDSSLKSEAQNYPGECCVFQLLEFVKEWIETRHADASSKATPTGAASSPSTSSSKNSKRSSKSRGSSVR